LNERTELIYGFDWKKEEYGIKKKGLENHGWRKEY
jgi:hypothetical protein